MAKKKTATKKSKKAKLVSVYEAAVLIQLSPTLLKWLTKYAPKSDSSRKLLVAKRSKEVLFFDRNEVIAYDVWLRRPWPSKAGKRPSIPTGIRAEIKEEAYGSCAMCQSYAGTCEAAHLDPVAQSKNNHPHNLIWLCANHHTAYDKGLLGPKHEDRAFVQGYKRSCSTRDSRSGVGAARPCAVYLRRLKPARNLSGRQRPPKRAPRKTRSRGSAAGY